MPRVKGASLRNPERECRAHRKNGEKCRRSAIIGGKVCRMHGGAAPQVAKAGMDRHTAAIAALVEPALQELGRIVRGGDSDNVKLGAIKEVLNRFLGLPQQHVDVTTNGPLIKAYIGVDLDKV